MRALKTTEVSEGSRNSNLFSNNSNLSLFCVLRSTNTIGEHEEQSTVV